VPAGDEEPQDGILDAGVFEKTRFEMSFQVVDADKRFLVIVGQALGEGQAHKKRPNETRPLGHGVEVDRFECNAGARQRFADDGRDRFDVLARGQLRNDATVGCVNIVLGQDDVAEDLWSDGGTGDKCRRSNKHLRRVSPFLGFPGRCLHQNLGGAQNGRRRFVARSLDG